jgi:pyrimidine operon attenuation protein/uracil phosphoribosyltransferase
MNFSVKAKLNTSDDLRRIVNRLAHEIIEKNRGTKDLVIIGLRTRGAYIAERISKKIKEIEGYEVPTGYLDVTLYRDDFRKRLKHPDVQVTNIPFQIDEKNVTLVDDVLFTGRTIRAALDALMDFGRPNKINLAVIVDRGHRELPIKADFIGKNIPTSMGEEIQVKIREVDDEDCIYLIEQVAEGEK